MKTRNETEGYTLVTLRDASYQLRRSEYDGVTTAIRRCEAFYEREDPYGSNIFLVLRNSDGCSTVVGVVEFTPASLEAQGEDAKIEKLREAIG